MKQFLSGPSSFVRITKSILIRSYIIADIFVDRKPKKPLLIAKCHCDVAEEEDVWELDCTQMSFVKVKKAVGCGENCINR